MICQSEELEIEGFSKNPPNRCYLCKKELFEKIGDIAKKNGIEYIAEGSNMDDKRRLQTRSDRRKRTWS